MYMTCDEESKSAKAKQTKNPLKITVYIFQEKVKLFEQTHEVTYVSLPEPHHN